MLEVVMKRLLAVVAAVGGIGALILLPASGGAQASGATTLTFFEPDSGGTFKVVDNAPKSPSPNPQSRRFRFSVGDEVVFSARLFDRQGGTRQGTLYVDGKVIKGTTFANASLIASGVYVLNDGSQIDVHGAFRFSATANVAIIGGSGRYAGARGSLKSTNSDTSTTDTLTLLP
jgi:hypothetical protein